MGDVLYKEVEYSKYVGHKPGPVHTTSRFNTVAIGRTRRVRCGLPALTLLTFHLTHLLRAGVPLLGALEEVATLEPRGAMQRVLTELQTAVANGSSLSKAMRNFPGVFNQEYVAVIAAGETCGRLPECLAHLEKSLRWQYGSLQRLQSLLIYPFFAFALLLVAVCFLLGYVVPSMVGFISQQGHQLPWHTRALLTLSDQVQRQGILWGVSTLTVVFTGMLVTRHNGKARLLRDQMVLQSGPLGRLLCQLMLARFTHTVSLLCRSGIEFVDAWNTSIPVVKNCALQRELRHASEKILLGNSVADALQSVRWIPSTLTRLTAAGESAGALGAALTQASQQLYMSARYSLDRVEQMLNPILLCIIGGLMLWVVVSILGPVYEMVLAVGISP